MPSPRIKPAPAPVQADEPLKRGVPISEYDESVREWAEDMGAPAYEGDDPSPPPTAKPKRAPRKRKPTTTTTPSAETPPPLPPPAPPTECNECHTPFDRRDALYVPARAGALCKRCWQRQERARLAHGRLVKPAAGSGKGGNRAQRRAAGVRNAEPMRLELVRPKTQSSGRRARKRHHAPPCLCCRTPSPAPGPEETEQRGKRGVA